MSGNQPTAEGYRAAIQALKTYRESLLKNVGLLQKTDTVLEGNLSSVRKAKGIHDATGNLVSQLNKRAQEIDDLINALSARLKKLLEM